MACTRTNQSSLLVYGYIRDIEVYNIPIDIVNLIYSYHPKKYKIYGVGSNLFGEFAINDCTKLNTYRELTEYSNICDDANDFYYGSYRFLIKNIKNEIYSAGWNLDGALGVNSMKRKILSLQQIERGDKDDNNNNYYVINISNGLLSMHTFIIDSTNAIHAFGNNKDGQFGNGSRSSYRFLSPFKLINTNKYFSENNLVIIRIETGAWHSLFLSKCGRVFSCGRNRFGQCGIKKEYEFQLLPTKIPFLYNVKDISCGEHHSVVLDKTGNVYGFGCNQYGQIGILNKDTDNIIDIATLNPFFKYKNIESISSGNSHSICINNNGYLWLFGRNQFGQLGTGNITEWDEGVFKPHLFQSLTDFENILISSASCGLNHTIVLSKKNEIYAFGENYYNQCSTKISKPQIKYPTLITKEEIGIDEDCFIKRVIAGYETTIIIIEY